MGTCKPGLTEFIPFFCASAIWGQGCSPSCLHSPSSSATSGAEWQHLLGHSFGRSPSHLEGRDRWWLWHFLFINMEGDIFISLHYKLFITDFHKNCCLLFPPKGDNNNNSFFLYQGANPEAGDTATSPGVNQMLAEGAARTSARSGPQGGLSHIPGGVQGTLAPWGSAGPASLAPREPPRRSPSSALSGTLGIPSSRFRKPPKSSTYFRPATVCQPRPPRELAIQPRALSAALPSWISEGAFETADPAGHLSSALQSLEAGRKWKRLAGPVGQRRPVASATVAGQPGSAAWTSVEPGGTPSCQGR